MRKTSLMLAVLAIIIFAPKSVLAFNMVGGDQINIRKDEPVVGTLYAGGGYLEINGAIDGDLICAGRKVVINAPINGDVICTTEILEINAPVAGSVRGIISETTLNNTVARNVTILGSSVIISKPATVGLDVLLATDYARISGVVNGNVHGNIEQLVVNGQIGQDINIAADKNKTSRPPLIINSNSEIKGNILYRSDQKAQISDQTLVGGQVYQEDSQTSSAKSIWSGLASMWVLMRLIGLFSILILGLIMIHFFRRQLLSLSDAMVMGSKKNILTGLVLIIGVPIICVLLLITILGIPLAFILFMLWLLIILSSKALIGFMVGRSIWGHYRHKMTKAKRLENNEAKLYWPMIVGIVVVSIIFAIPIVGAFFSLVSVAWVVGTMWILARKQ